MKKLLIPVLLLSILVVAVSCNEKKKREKKETIVARTIDDYANMPGGVIRNCYADSTPRDVYFYKVDEQGNRTDELVQEVHCYENRNIYMEGAIKHEERDGVWNAYFKNGRLQATCTYKEGIQVGEEKVYYENGKLLYSGQYDNGICVGKWEFFNENGIKTVEINANDTTIACRACPKCETLMQKENEAYRASQQKR